MKLKLRGEGGEDERPQPRPAQNLTWLFDPPGRKKKKKKL